MPSAVNQSPGGCQCGGDVCVTAQSICDPYPAVDGATFTLYAHGTSTVLGTATTDAAGHACITASGSFDLTVSKSGFDLYAATGVAGSTSVVMQPSGTGGSVITVYGCGGFVLPGASLVFQGPSPSTDVVATLTSDSAGEVHFVPAVPGSYSFTASMARFDSQASVIIAYDPCSVPTTKDIILLAAAGYVCCKPPTPPGMSDSPIPTSTTLYITTAGGTDSFTLDAATCGQTITLTKNMSDVGPSGPIDGGTCGTPPYTSTYQVPPTISTSAAEVGYSFKMNDGGAPSLSEGLREFRGPGSPGVGFSYGGGCTGLDDKLAMWRLPNGTITGNTIFRDATSFVINSLSPLSITFTIPAEPGDGYGPIDQDPYTGDTGGHEINGQPYSTSVTISE